MMYGSSASPPRIAAQRGRLCSSSAVISPIVNLKISDQKVNVTVVHTDRTKKSSRHRFW